MVYQITLSVAQNEALLMSNEIEVTVNGIEIHFVNNTPKRQFVFGISVCVLEKKFYSYL
jgi:hypothetical protein